MTAGVSSSDFIELGVMHCFFIQPCFFSWEFYLMPKVTGSEVLCWISSEFIRETWLCIMLTVLSKNTSNMFLKNINIRLGEELLCN